MLEKAHTHFKIQSQEYETRIKLGNFPVDLLLFVTVERAGIEQLIL